MSSRLILASASPRRRELLAAVGLRFETASLDLDEASLAAQLGPLPPEQVALRLAMAKANVTGRGEDTVALTADTVVAIGGRILGKPGDSDEAEAMLRLLRGREHAVASAVALRSGDELATDVAAARVLMRAYSDQEIARYVATGGPMDKAGAYAIQDAVFAPVAALDGCYCGVMGLPLYRTAALLRRAGLNAQAPRLPQCASCPDAHLLDTFAGRLV